MFCLPHTIHIKQDFVFKGWTLYSVIMSFLLVIIPHFPLPVLVFLPCLFFTVTDSMDWTRSSVFISIEKQDRILGYSLFFAFRANYWLICYTRWCHVMSLAAMCKNCNYCCSINSTSVAFGRCCFTGNFRYFHSNCGCAPSNQIILSYWYHFWTEISLFFDNLRPIFIGNQNICKANLAVPYANEKSNCTETKFEHNFFLFFWNKKEHSLLEYLILIYLWVLYLKRIVVDEEPC